jgi:hypothetical protein
MYDELFYEESIVELPVRLETQTLNIAVVKQKAVAVNAFNIFGSQTAVAVNAAEVAQGG